MLGHLLCNPSIYMLYTFLFIKVQFKGQNLCANDILKKYLNFVGNWTDINFIAGSIWYKYFHNHAHVYKCCMILVMAVNLRTFFAVFFYRQINWDMNVYAK